MEIIRLTEWGAHPSKLNRETRFALSEATAQWRSAQDSGALPFKWGGADGRTLLTNSWVGVIETEGVRIEIYPKLDKALLEGKKLDQPIVDSALRALLPMLEAANYGDWVETGDAALGETQLSFIDVWAFLLGRHLSLELRRGLVASYQNRRDDLAGVRGKIAVGRQVGALFNRMDRIACEWDEFSADTPMNRLLKCACRLLQRRTSHPVARGLLSDCAMMLEEAADVAPAVALRETERLIWTRGAERYRASFDLARRLLRELSPELEGGDSSSWAFLVNMNSVFEGFCRAALEARFGVAVEEQVPIGYLFSKPNLIAQKPDFMWQRDGARWIGDAKWKLMGDKAPDISENDNAGGISPADARQLSVYALLLWGELDLSDVPATAILYPTLNAGATPQRLRSWNGGYLCLWPVRVRDARDLASAIAVGDES